MKVLIAETVDWDTSVRIGSHHYAQRFLERGDEVLWTSQYAHPFSLLTGERKRARYALRLRHGARCMAHERLSLYVPFTFLPCRRRRFLDSEKVACHSLRFAVPSVPRVLEGLGFDKVDVVWISNPLLAGLLDIVRHEVVVLRVNDRYSGFRGMPRCTQALERKMVRRADVIFATSRVLCEYVRGLGGQAVYLPNGVEFRHFTAPAPEPVEYGAIPSPRVIYAGAIESWFDVDLLLTVAKNLRDVSFVLVGQCGRSEAQALEGIPNVHLLGPKPYADLPAYYRHAEAGVIPFQINELTAAVNPNKLYEYFAVGLPVVSTYIPEIERLQPLVRIARNADEFASFLREELRSGIDGRLRDERIKCAEANSWSSRFEDAVAHVCSALNSRLPSVSYG